MDNESPYKSEADSFIEELINDIGDFFNVLGLTQWAVNKEKREAKMNEIIATLREGLAEDEKLLAAAKALEADSTANTAAASMAAIANSIAVASQTAVSAEEAVNEAAGRIATAKTTIATAKTNLEAAKAAVSDASIKGAKLAELKAKIEAAEEAVGTAEEELEIAVASKTMAEFYKIWANELIEDQVTQAYIWDEETLSGEGRIRLENDATFYIDYVTFRNYIKEMLQYNELPETQPLSEKKMRGDKVVVTYWEVAKDENGNRYLTGKHYTEDKLPNADAEYFVGYQFSYFNNEFYDDGQTGYHLDGAIVTTEYKEPVVNPEPTPNPPSNDYYPSNVVVNNNTVDLTNDNTPEGLGADNTDQTPAIILNDDKEETPQGAVPNTLKLGDDETAQGAALPKTGTAPVAVFYFAAVMLLLAGLFVKRSFARER